MSQYLHKLQVINGLKTDDAARTAEGWASRYGEVDSYGDVVAPGAFKATLQGRDGPIPFLWQHKSDQPIGTLQAEDRPEGLWIKATFNRSTQALDAYEHVKSGAVQGFSIGYDAQEVEADKNLRGKNGAPANRLKLIKLYEVSAVTFPALTSARIISVKSAFGEWVTNMPSETKAEAGSAQVGDLVQWGDGDAPSTGQIDYIFTGPDAGLADPEAAPTVEDPWIKATIMVPGAEGTLERGETTIEMPLSMVALLGPAAKATAPEGQFDPTQAATDPQAAPADAGDPVANFGAFIASLRACADLGDKVMSDLQAASGADDGTIPGNGPVAAPDELAMRGKAALGGAFAKAKSVHSEALIAARLDAMTATLFASNPPKRA